MAEGAFPLNIHHAFITPDTDDGAHSQFRGVRWPPALIINFAHHQFRGVAFLLAPSVCRPRWLRPWAAGGASRPGAPGRVAQDFLGTPRTVRTTTLYTYIGCGTCIGCGTRAIFVTAFSLARVQQTVSCPDRTRSGLTLLSFPTPFGREAR